MDSATQTSMTKSRDVSPTDTLLFFPRYLSSDEVSKRVLRTLLAFQIINFCCIVAALTMVASAINNTTLQKEVNPLTVNLKGILVIITISLPFIPLRIILWQHGIRSRPIMGFRLFVTAILGLNIVLWCLIIFVLAMRENLPDNLDEGKITGDRFPLHSMQVCLLLFCKRRGVFC